LYPEMRVGLLKLGRPVFRVGAGRKGFRHRRLPGALLCRETLGFLSGENGLALGLGLARDFGEALDFRLARCFGGFGCKAGCELGFFLALALGFFFLAALLFGESLFDAQTGFFAGLGARGGEISVLGSVQIGPGVEGCHVLRGVGVALFDQGFLSHRIGFRYCHLQTSLANPHCRTAGLPFASRKAYGGISKETAAAIVANIALELEQRQWRPSLQK
jgi:hypothetical protein